MDRKRIFMASIIAVMGLVLMLTPTAMAAATGSGSAAGQAGSSGGASGHSGSSVGTSLYGGGQSGDIYSGVNGPDSGYWPNGPASSVPVWNGIGPHNKGWIGGPLNPWIYGGSNNLGSFGRGSLSELTWPAPYYSSGNYWRTGGPRQYAGW